MIRTIFYREQQHKTKINKQFWKRVKMSLEIQLALWLKSNIFIAVICTGEQNNIFYEILILYNCFTIKLPYMILLIGPQGKKLL